MKKNIVVGWTAAILALASAGSLLAHHSLAQFDTTTAVRVKGVVVRFEQVNPHSLLFIDQKGEDGKIQRWALEGPSVLQFQRRGIALDAFKYGDVVEACGYATKPGAEPQINVKDWKAVSVRLMDAELIVMPNGEKRVWSDYGHHKCLDPGYTDFHSE
jgi:hypothetical protein